MKRWSWTKRISVTLSCVVAFAIVAGYAGLYTLAALACGNDQILEFPSPDGARKAVVYRRDCGATTDWSQQMVLLPRWRSVHSWSWPDPLFVTDGDMVVAPTWIDATHLKVVYGPLGRDDRAKAVRLIESAGPVTIFYHFVR